MRRSVGEAMNSRFVTGDRVELVLQVYITMLVMHVILITFAPRKCLTCRRLGPQNTWMAP